MFGNVIEAARHREGDTLSRSGFQTLELGLDIDVIESGLELNDAMNELIENLQKRRLAIRPADIYGRPGVFE
jgi:hypothetical protein